MGDRLIWLGYVLSVSTHWIHRRPIMAGARVGWENARGGKTKKWNQTIKTQIIGLSGVGRCRQISWSQINCRNQLLETVTDIARDRLQDAFTIYLHLQSKFRNHLYSVNLYILLKKSLRCLIFSETTDIVITSTNTRFALTIAPHCINGVQWLEPVQIYSMFYIAYDWLHAVSYTTQY